jgi:electron transport complex protein RnfG
MGADGNVTGIVILDHNETPGLGSKITSTAYLARYYGAVDRSAVDVITGASISSGALKRALSLATEAFAIAKGAH